GGGCGSRGGRSTPCPSPRGDPRGGAPGILECAGLSPLGRDDDERSEVTGRRPDRDPGAEQSPHRRWPDCRGGAAPGRRPPREAPLEPEGRVASTPPAAGDPGERPDSPERGHPRGVECERDGGPAGAPGSPVLDVRPHRGPGEGARNGASGDRDCPSGKWMERDRGSTEHGASTTNARLPDGSARASAAVGVKMIDAGRSTSLESHDLTTSGP